ncbi:hypothetical protein BS50DRAFT_631827 [Corynespora cassiicola Philippines]|uniref:Uncharacterized protein n=1 Tax=Corynespora cassiicola Philippines TaxID=1448308 RepID=A0A2T2NWR2_CORCC|nr:hypothetical protein BS50DRAFT_631827 [Corynespora cassiicola Philippines]
MPITHSETLPKSGSWNYGIWSTLIYVISFGYVILVVIAAVIPQAHMNYTVLTMADFAVLMTISWFVEGKKPFKLPVNDEDIIASVIEGLDADEESQVRLNDSSKVGYDGDTSRTVSY